MTDDESTDDREKIDEGSTGTDTAAGGGSDLDADEDAGAEAGAGVEPEPEPDPDPASDSGSGARARLEAEADRAVTEFDEGVVDLLAWLLDTETRARIYVYLRQNPHSTSEEVADGTGLYPSTVREALAELHEEETVERRKRTSAGAGNNPYEYTAIAPSELVRGVVGQVQSELNTVFNLDRRLGDVTGRDESDTGDGIDVGPVSITVDDEASGDDERGDDERGDERGADASEEASSDAESDDAGEADERGGDERGGDEGGDDEGGAEL